MIEFLLGVGIGHMLFSNKGNSNLNGDEYLTIRTTGNARIVLINLLKKYCPSKADFFTSCFPPNHRQG